MPMAATPMGSDSTSEPVGQVIWELTKIVVIAGATAIVIKALLNRG